MEEALGRSPPQREEIAGKATIFVNLTVKAWYNIRIESGQ